MCREMDEIYNEGAKKGISVTDIADIVKVSAKLVQEWLSGSVGLAK